MQTVAIIGAGAIGALTARCLAALELVSAIRLIDATGTVAAGKALDLLQAGPVDGSDTRITGSTALGDAAGADAVVVADRAGADGEWQGDAGLEMVRRLLGIVPGVPLVFAGAAQRQLMAVTLLELGVPSARVIGTAPEALTSAARALVGAAADCSALDVALAVVGVPGAWIPAWAECTLAATPISAALPPHVLLRLEQQIAASWPPGAYSLASAAAHGVRAVLSASRRRVTCFAALDGELYGRPVVAAVPVTVWPAGVRQVHIPALSARERLSFETALVTR
jgi:malate dehydrogenase